MGTKLNPGKYDCYARLAEDEPFFVLRGKDPDGPLLVRLWVQLRRRVYGDYEKLKEAELVASEMEAWRMRNPQARPSVPAPFQVVHDQPPPPHAKYLVERDGWHFVATPCYGMHEPWWVGAIPPGVIDHPTREVDPVAMHPADRWRPLSDVVEAPAKDRVLFEQDVRRG